MTVADRNDQPVTELTTERFRGKFRGQPVKIMNARFQSAPGRLVIVMDGSGSMQRLLEKHRGWTMAGNAVAFAPAGEGLGLLVFAEDIRLRVELTPDRQTVMDRLKAYLAEAKQAEGRGRTAVNDAVHAAVQMLSPARIGDAIYLITDGGDNRSKVRAKEVERALVGAGVRLFALVPTDVYYPVLPANVEGLQAVKHWAQITGGYALLWKSESSSPERLQLLDEFVRRMYHDMRNYYQLTIELPLAADKQRDWKLEVVDERGKKMGSLDVSYPWIAPCSGVMAQREDPR